MASIAQMRSPRALNRELSRLARSKELSACRAAFTAGKALGVVDAWSHAILINAHATCGDGAGALRALGAMRAAGERPCVMSYTSALKAPCGLGDLGVARRLLAEMEADFAAAARRRGAAAGAGRRTTYTQRAHGEHLLRGCLVAGGLDEALGLLSKLGDAPRRAACGAASCQTSIRSSMWGRCARWPPL